MLTNKLKKKIEKAEYISFDIFDTLIKRNFEKPIDVFKYIEYKHNWPGFYKRRIEAENICRLNTKKEEININDIYENLSDFYSKKEINILQKLEEKIEINCCVLNPNIEEILEYCEKKNKKIIIISDMYLKEETIKAILKKNEIKYQKLYISTVIGFTKRTGKLFEYVCNDLKANPSSILHIGDNFKSDYVMAQKKRIKVHKIPTDILNIEHYNKIATDDEKNLKYFINNKITKKTSYFYKFGYSILGPLLYGFSIWLNKEIKNNNIEKILFLSRDGLIMKKAYDLIYPQNKKSIYFYASRRALIVPSLSYYNNVDEMLKNIYFDKEVTLKSILKSLGIEEENTKVKDNLEKFGINLLDNVIVKDLNDTNNTYRKFLINIFDYIKEESNKERKALLKYLNDNIQKDKKVALVDIGWFGNMQNALEKILKNEKLDYELYGYYVGLVPENTNQLKYEMSGYLFDKHKNIECHEYERRYNAIFETMFLAKHGSLKKYYVDNNKNVRFEFKEYENEKNLDFINEFQTAALEFIEDMNKNLINIDFENIEFNKIINDFGTNPNYKDAKNWGNILFENSGKLLPIAKPKTLINYLINVKLFIIDFNQCYWKIGFLKRLLKVKLNYNKIYEILRKRVK